MSVRAVVRALAIALGLGLAAPVIAAPGVDVAFVPRVTRVAPDSTFELAVEVTRAGAAFNAFDLVIGWDPEALTLLPQTPQALEEGEYFVAACGNRFHHVQHGAGADTIADVLLCAGQSLTGPGQIYRLRFRAGHTAQATIVRFRHGLQFYDAGLYVDPDSASDAVVAIGVEPTAADFAAVGAHHAVPRRVAISPDNARATPAVTDSSRMRAGARADSSATHARRRESRVRTSSRVRSSRR